MMVWFQMRTSKLCIKNDKHPKPQTLDIVVSFGDWDQCHPERMAIHFLVKQELNKKKCLRNCDVILVH